MFFQKLSHTRIRLQYLYQNQVQVQQLSLLKISMMEKLPKQQSVDIRTIPFHNDDPMNFQLENTGKFYLHYKPNHHYIIFYTQFHKQTHQLHLTC